LARAVTDTGCLNLRWALALLDGLIAGGLRRLVLSPGSRSTPVVLAAQRRPAIAITPILDERSAAFFALGLARASGRPVAVLATSGSAPAHWYPAVIEAAHWGLPLVLISADRPPLLRHSGANQTIDQTRLFGAFVREFHDPGLPHGDSEPLKAVRALGWRAATRALGPTAGPVHINLPFAEPLVPAGDCPEAEQGREVDATDRACTTAQSARVAAPDALLTPLHAPLPRGRGVMVCGPGSAATPEEAQALLGLAARLGLPVLADPLSGLRYAGQAQAGAMVLLVRHYDAMLRNPEAAERLKPDWVLRCGLAPVSKTLGHWLTGVPSWLFMTGARWCDPSHDALGAMQTVMQTRVATRAGALSEPAWSRIEDPDWYARWQMAERGVQSLADAQLQNGPWCEAQLIAELLRAIPAGEGLLCANSLPIRQLETWSYQRREALHLFGNRGVSGIDGQVSTLAGLNASGVPTWGLLGDLSFCHDLSGLLLARELKRPLILINNGGGRIFDYLPQRALPEIERYWRTPVTPDLGALVKPFGLSHQRVQDAEGLAAALAASPGACLIEAHIHAEQSREMHLAFWQRVARAALFESSVSAA
jgi:2-succinyl-5-enolpyruvyl-6-hydroxy-3-cyclohexene-1-carboxylate synthase